MLRCYLVILYISLGENRKWQIYTLNWQRQFPLLWEQFILQASDFILTISCSVTTADQKGELTRELQIDLHQWSQHP